MMFLFCWVIWSVGHCKRELEFEPATQGGGGLKTLRGYRRFWRKLYYIAPVEIVPFLKSYHFKKVSEVLLVPERQSI